MNILKLTVLGIVLFLSTSVKSQVTVNIGSPPLWGPVGYTDVRYYYLPDVEAYYDVQSSMFIYFGNGVWLRRAYLPGHYRNYDLYDGYKVVITDYRGNEPYIHFHDHKVKYKKGYRGGSQKTIGQKPGKGNSPKKMNSNEHQNKQGNQGNKQMNQRNKQNEGHGGNKGGSQGGGSKGKKK